VTDTQFGIIVSALTTLGLGFIAMLKWAVERVVKAIDRNSDTNTNVVSALARFEVQLKEIRNDVTPVTPIERPGYRAPGPPGRGG
jgi:hypothetical protein